MATYFIGDVHGCYDELMLLLEKIAFSTREDRLIFVGDLVNRGKKSIEVVRFIKNLGNRAHIVLGNHDVSWLAYQAGVYSGKGTSFPDMRYAKDSDELLFWLRQQPLMLYDKQQAIVAVHAGIAPHWSIEKAQKQAQKAEKKLRSENWVAYLNAAYRQQSHKPEPWLKEADKWYKFRYRINAFTRMRFCDKEGTPDLQEKGGLGQQSTGLVPWFVRRRKLQQDKVTIVFGHWAALGFYQSEQAICIDSGCAWGGALTAVKFTTDGLVSTQVKALKRKS